MNALKINAKFSTQRQTGVQRVAREIVSRLQTRHELISPTSASQIRGILWEQLFLPYKLDSKQLLFSPCNIGPVAHRKQILCIHDVCVLEHPEWFDRKFHLYYKATWKRLAHQVLFITTVSESSKRRIVEILDVAPEKVIVINNAVSEAFFKNEDIKFQPIQDKFNLPNDYVLCVGSFDGRKNQLKVVEAWKKISDKFNDTKLVFVGDSGKNFSSSGNQQVLSEAIFTGYVSEEELLAIYENAKLFVYPSLYEGFGLPVLEAMAAGLPVITSKGSPMEEFAKEAGLLVDPRNADEIAMAMDELLSNQSLCNSLSQKAKEIAGEYKWEYTARRYDELFAKAMEMEI